MAVLAQNKNISLACIDLEQKQYAECIQACLGGAEERNVVGKQHTQ